MLRAEHSGAWASRLDAVLGAWRSVGTPMAEIEADLESTAPDLPIGRATDVAGGAQRRVGQKARCCARRVAARGESDGGDRGRSGICGARSAYWQGHGCRVAEHSGEWVRGPEGSMLCSA
jgi:hypothetical protein